MKIVVLSDTHIPRTANDLPPEIYSAIKKADLVLHAGDFCERELYDNIAAITELRAVCGNMDTGELHALLPRKEIVEADGARIGLVHGHGAARDIVETVWKEFAGEKIDAIVFGHSHTAYNESRSGILLFNPGTPTDRIFAACNTYGILTVARGRVEGSIVSLDGRSNP